MSASSRPDPRRSLQLLELEGQLLANRLLELPSDRFVEPSNLPDWQIFDLCAYHPSVRLHPEGRAAVRGGRPDAGLWCGRAATRTGDSCDVSGGVGAAATLSVW